MNDFGPVQYTTQDLYEVLSKIEEQLRELNNKIVTINYYSGPPIYKDNDLFIHSIKDGICTPSGISFPYICRT